MNFLLDLAVLASEEYVPASDWRAQIALPMGILILLGGVYLLLRANLGTRRGYFLLGSSFFGFMLLISMFWAFGGPGTPPYSGPQNLPGQPIDYYQPKWIPFAGDSVVADQPEYEAVSQFPEGFEPLEEGDDSQADEGKDTIQEFFASEEAGQPMRDSWVVTEMGTTEAENGRPLLGVEYTEADEDEPMEPAADGDSYVAFGYFQEGNLMLPNLVFIVLSALGFAFHVGLLAWDERRERRDLEEDLGVTEEERVPTPA